MYGGEVGELFVIILVTEVFPRNVSVEWKCNSWHSKLCFACLMSAWSQTETCLAICHQCTTQTVERSSCNGQSLMIYIVSLYLFVHRKISKCFGTCTYQCLASYDLVVRNICCLTLKAKVTRLGWTLWILFVLCNENVSVLYRLVLYHFTTLKFKLSDKSLIVCIQLFPKTSRVIVIT